MKKILLSIATVMITFGVYAQSESTYSKEIQKNNKQFSDSENLNHPDGFMLQEGEMMMVKNGDITRLEKDTTVSNGTIIMSDGYYMEKDKSKIMLQEGEHMDMAGKITLMDSADYNKIENGYLFKAGKLMKVKNGNMTPLDVDIQLINGTAVMKNGYYKKEGEQKMKFQEGQHIDMSGELSQTNKIRRINYYNKLNKPYKIYPISDSIRNK
ncbi:MAG: DUF6799 domain-containing protein [Bacteroidota bacterium]